LQNINIQKPTISYSRRFNGKLMHSKIVHIYLKRCSICPQLFLTTASRRCLHSSMLLLIKISATVCFAQPPKHVSVG